MQPTNDIERILDSKRFGPQDYPTVFRLLLESELIFLIPIQPEAPRVIVWEGDGTPDFSLMGQANERRIPIFSSVEAARTCCRSLGAWKQFSFCQVNGRKLFQILAQQELWVLLNPSCTRSELHMDTAAIRKLADGSLLTQNAGERVEGTLKPLDPAEYPTDFIQALFEFLRKTNSVRAAWVFKHLEASGKICYVFLLDAPNNPPEVEKEFTLIARLACPKTAEWGMRFLDLNDSEMARIPEEFTPFYRSASL